MRFVALILVASFVPTVAAGGDWLDFLRNYDLNNYAAGIAVSSRQSPYAGADNSTFAYPYLTSFRHPAMTDDLVVMRSGALGLRRITSSKWEFGIAGRIQTMGFGENESEQLLGVEEPRWTVELGPSIGIRRWPVHVWLATWFEPTDRHDGIKTQLAFSYPIKWPRAYLVPSVEAIYESADYTDYYYAVSEGEATATRPAYRPGAAISTEAQLEWGYALSDQWLLSGKLRVEKLASEIRNSPLVDREQLWSFNLGLAYNSDPFGPVGLELANTGQQRFELRVGAFMDNVDSTLSRDSANGVPGSETDLESVLGESDAEGVLQVDLSWRIARYHRIEAGYFELARNGSVTPTEELQFGDTRFDAGAELNSRSLFKSLRVGYAYSLIEDSQKELGVMAGVHYSSFDSTIAERLTGVRESSRADAPLPVVGVHASVRIGEKTVVGAKLQIFRTEFDQYDGSINYLTVAAERHVSRHLNLGVGYNYYAINLHSDLDALRGTLKMRHEGPVLFLSYAY